MTPPVMTADTRVETREVKIHNNTRASDGTQEKGRGRKAGVWAGTPPARRGRARNTSAKRRLGSGGGHPAGPRHHLALTRAAARRRDGGRYIRVPGDQGREPGGRQRALSGGSPTGATQGPRRAQGGHCPPPGRHPRVSCCHGRDDGWRVVTNKGLPRSPRRAPCRHRRKARWHRRVPAARDRHATRRRGRLAVVPKPTAAPRPACCPPPPPPTPPPAPKPGADALPPPPPPPLQPEAAGARAAPAPRASPL